MTPAARRALNANRPHYVWSWQRNAWHGRSGPDRGAYVAFVPGDGWRRWLWEPI